MTSTSALELDAVIFGGGASGLWLLDELVRRRRRVLLLETSDLGSGQTVASQGIIHGGLKYALGGRLTASAAAIRGMPLRWRRCLAGEAQPDLRGTRLRGDFCHMWRTGGLLGRLSLAAARIGLQVTPTALSADERPEVLARCPGTVARLDEQVIEPASFIGVLSDQHRPHIFHIDCDSGLEFDITSPGTIRLIRLINPNSGEALDLQPAEVVLAAGAGNERLRRLVGLTDTAMQRRPLHMVLVRGRLPWLNGHCVDGSATRVTITSTRDSEDQVIWQVGGRIAEEGTAMTPRDLIDHARRELRACVPGLELDGLQWNTYSVDRAEASEGEGKRPAEARLRRDGNTITCWPTKLALVPVMADETVEALRLSEDDEPTRRFAVELDALRHWPRPAVALPMWERSERWINDH